MVDKTELQLKAAEKRFDAIERSIDTLKKDSSSSDTAAQLRALSNKVDTLAVTVKELGVQMVLKHDLKNATKIEASERDRYAEALEIRIQAEADKVVKEQKAQADKAVAEQKAILDKFDLEQLRRNGLDLQMRVKTLEAQMAAAMRMGR